MAFQVFQLPLLARSSALRSLKLSELVASQISQSVTRIKTKMAPAAYAAAALLLRCLSLLLLLVDVDGRSASLSVASSLLAGTRHDRSLHSIKPAFIPRGGATLVEDEYDSEEYDEYDEEELEDEVSSLAAAAKAKVAGKANKAKAKAADLSASTVKATAKAKSKRTAAVKESLSAQLATKPQKRKGNKKSILQLLRVPYIVRACLNPVTVIAMTRAYFASLFNISFLEEEESQTLRSALEDKAKKPGGSAGGGGRKGKRAMRPGQAKTLSDLPQLSA